MKDGGPKQGLVLLAQAGDRAAQNDLLREVQAGLYRYLRHLVGRDDLAEDVLQDVSVLVVRKLRWLRDPVLFRAWLHRLATREAFLAIKREARHRGPSPDEVEFASVCLPSGDEIGPDDELLERLPELVDALSPKGRAVFLLHYGQVLRLDETAQVLGLSVGTVKSRLAYGLKILRDRLGVVGENQ